MCCFKFRLFKHFSANFVLSRCRYYKTWFKTKSKLVKICLNFSLGFRVKAWLKTSTKSGLVARPYWIFEIALEPSLTRKSRPISGVESGRVWKIHWQKHSNSSQKAHYELKHSDSSKKNFDALWLRKVELNRIENCGDIKGQLKVQIQPNSKYYLRPH